MNWKKLTFPAYDLLDFGENYVLGEWNEQLQEVVPLYIFEVKKFGENDIFVSDKSTYEEDTISDNSYYFIHLSKHVPL